MSGAIEALFPHGLCPYDGLLPWVDEVAQESINKAIELAQKSLARDDTRAEIHGLLSQLYAIKRNYDRAIAEGERGIALNPNGADAQFWYASALTNACRPEEAIPLFQKALRLNPHGPSRYFLNSGHAFRMAGRLEEAVSLYKKGLQREPNNFLIHLGLTATYSLMNLEKEAHAEAAEVLRLNPKFSVDYWAKISVLKEQSEIDKFTNALRKAGLK